MSEAVSTAGRLADGDWHRLHPATPVLRGGFATVALIGVIIVNLRDVAIENIFGSPFESGDPVRWALESGFVVPGLLGVLGVLVLLVGAFYFSWRMHTFRITDELVEVRSGILFRTHRRGRLDRIQGVNIVRPFLARLVGAAKLEIVVAGHDANVHLSYLGSASADELRREILLLASGTHSSAATSAAPAAGLIEQRVSEFLAPELDPDAAAPESVVQLHLGRLVGSLVLSGFTVLLVIGISVASIVISQTGEYLFLLWFLPAVIGVGSFYISRFTRSLRYSIAGTPDGIRVGFGLLSTSNETLPPGRIHAIQVSQPLLWRPAGWWEIKINRAASSSARGAAGQANTTILPVGDIDDVLKVLGLLLHGSADEGALDLFELGLTSRGGDDGFHNSPRRAGILRWFSWRRNGFVVAADVVLLRRGAVWRELVIVPQARLQSLLIRQGPVLRKLRLASLQLHTVAGPVSARLGAVDRDAAVALFDQVSHAAIRSAGQDTSHRWRAE